MTSLGLTRIDPAVIEAVPEPAARATFAGAARTAMASIAGAVRKVRSRQSYSDLLAEIILSRVSGEAAVTHAAAPEVAARAVSRGLMSAEVRGLEAGVLAPSILAQIGRSLILRGESLHAVFFGQPPMLLAASNWDVTGDVRPDSWIYRADLTGPTRSTTETLRRDGVLHVVTDPDPSRPWRGTTPTSSDLAVTAAKAAAAMTAEHEIAVGRILPMPHGTRQAVVDRLRADLTAKAGRVAMPETTRAGWGEGRLGAPAGDWMSTRIGPDPPAGSIQAHVDAEARVAAAHGVHPAVMLPGATAGALREARRQFQIDVLEPIARLIATEASRVFARAVSIIFPPRTDIILLQARAAQTFAAIGVDPAEALVMAGVDRTDDYGVQSPLLQERRRMKKKRRKKRRRR